MGWVFMGFLHVLPRKEWGAVLWHKVLDSLKREVEFLGAHHIFPWLGAGVGVVSSYSTPYSGVVRCEDFAPGAAHRRMSPPFNHGGESVEGGESAELFHLYVGGGVQQCSSLMLAWVWRKMREHPGFSSPYFDFCRLLQQRAPEYIEDLLEQKESALLPSYVLPLIGEKWLPCALNSEDLYQSLARFKKRFQLQNKRELGSLEADFLFPRGWSLGWARAFAAEVGAFESEEELSSVGAFWMKKRRQGSVSSGLRWQSILYEGRGAPLDISSGDFEKLCDEMKRDQSEFFASLSLSSKPHLFVYTPHMLCDYVFYDLFRDVVSEKDFIASYLSKCLQGYNLWGRFFHQWGGRSSEYRGGSPLAAIHVHFKDPRVMEVLSLA